MAVFVLAVFWPRLNEPVSGAVWLSVEKSGFFRINQLKCFEGKSTSDGVLRLRFEMFSKKCLSFSCHIYLSRGKTFSRLHFDYNIFAFRSALELQILLAQCIFTITNATKQGR